MSTEISKIQELGLQVMPNQTKLAATFGENRNEIINAVELESSGAKLVITAHYASLPFGSKPDEYWNGKFKEDYAGLCVMCGIRNFTENLGLLDLKNCLVDDYPIHNEESLRIAVKMNLKGILGTTVEPFGEFNRVFVTKIMTPYENKLKRDHKRAIEIRAQLSPKKELTESEKETLLKNEIQMCYHRYVVSMSNDIELISYVMYDCLERCGKLSIPKEGKDELMNKAKAHLLTIPKNKYTFADMNIVADAKNQVIVIAKRLAVRDYFNQLIFNKVEQIF